MTELSPMATPRCLSDFADILGCATLSCVCVCSCVYAYVSEGMEGKILHVTPVCTDGRRQGQGRAVLLR